MNKLLCLDATPSFLNTFDFSVAPPLLFYSYVPVVIFLLFLSIFIARKDKFSLKSRVLLALGVSFSLWVINILIQWVAVEANIVYFAWQITALFEILIPLSTIYLTYVFIDNKDTASWLKALFACILLSVVVLLPTNFNMKGFDIVNCQASVGPMTYFVYSFEMLAVFWILGLSIRRYSFFLKNKIENNTKIKELILISSSSIAFLTTFSLSNIAGELSQVYSINLFGPIGMLAFVTILSYMIVRYKTFNVKVLSTQVLVWGLIFFIGSQFFFIRNPTNYFLNGITFVGALIFGNYLIRSVKREVEQKEYLQQLNIELQGLIKQRESLVHLITHKVKGSFTRTKFLMAEMLEGSYGVMSPMLTSLVKRGLESDIEGIATVDLVLNSANLQNGTVKYDMKPTDFKDIVSKVFIEKKKAAEGKGLAMESDFKEANGEKYNILGDTFWLKEVVINLLENSVRYTKAGKIEVILEEKNNKVLLTVQDTGVGITDEDKKNLFTEGGRGKDSVKINVDSTGYGLYSVRLIVEAHHGRIWAESQGADKGSTFYVEFDAVK